MAKWIKQWTATGSGRNRYTVSLARDGTYSCSCPHWIYRRETCKHINKIMSESHESIKHTDGKPKYVIVDKPTYDAESHTLFLPLVPQPDTIGMEVTICYHLLNFGFSMKEIRELRTIPDDWTEEAIKKYIERNGEAVYGLGGTDEENNKDEEENNLAPVHKI